MRVLVAGPTGVLGRRVTHGAPAGVYNVVDDEPITRSDLDGVLGAALGSRRPERSVLAGPESRRPCRSFDQRSCRAAR